MGSILKYTGSVFLTCYPISLQKNKPMYWNRICLDGISFILGFFFFFFGLGASLVVQMVKSLTAVQEALGSILGSERSPGEMAPCPSIVAWRIPWTEGPGGLQPLGSQRVRHDWATKHKQPEESQSTVFSTYLGCFFSWIYLMQENYPSFIGLLFFTLVALKINYLLLRSIRPGIWKSLNVFTLLACVIFWLNFLYQKRLFSEYCFFSLHIILKRPG